MLLNLVGGLGRIHAFGDVDVALADAGPRILRIQEVALLANALIDKRRVMLTNIWTLRCIGHEIAY